MPRSISEPQQRKWRIRAGRLVGALALTGCSGTVVSTTDASTTSTRALLTVERTSLVTGDAAVPPRAHAAAYFLRLQSSADQNVASRLVGESPELPPIGRCEAVQVLGDQGIPLASLGPVDLVDVGQVVVGAAATRATLATRAFPNVVDLISGVVYTTRDRVANPLPDKGTYTFEISGSPVFGATSFRAEAPGEVQGLAIAGVPLNNEPLVLPRADVPVAWQPQATGDALYVEFASAEDGPLERVRCSLGSNGGFVVPVAALPKANAQNVTVHLVRRESVTAPGLEAGEVRFDWATSFAIRFSSSAP